MNKTSVLSRLWKKSKCGKKGNQKKSKKRKSSRSDGPRDSSTSHQSSSVTGSTMLALGDSVVKRLNGWKMSNNAKCKVNVKAFPGAKIQDMYHYATPSLE